MLDHRQLMRRLGIALAAAILAVLLLPAVSHGITRGAFTRQVTEQLHADVTLHTRRAWAAELQAEGGGARFNPTNTTLRLPGSTSYNSVGVQNYTSAEQGIEATVRTLKENNGQRYHLIRRRLRANESAVKIVRGFGLSAWGTDLSLVLAVLDDIQNDRTPNRLVELEHRRVAG